MKRKQQTTVNPEISLKDKLAKRAKELEKEIRKLDDPRWDEKVRELRNIENRLFILSQEPSRKSLPILSLPQKNANAYNPNFNR